MAEISLERVRKSFGRVPVLQDIDITVSDGEFCVFLGPSGCGKSTLMRLIAGLEEACAGRIRIGGKDVTELPPKARSVSMVFQSYALYPHMSAYENMSFGLKLRRKGRGEIDRRVREAARILHIEDLLARKPAQLSGGQRQRVAIGRAIVREPEVFLFDEPLSNLDADLRVRMRLEFADLHQRLKTTMVYVTHDQVEAMTLAQKMVILEQGRVAQQGPPLSLYHSPRNLFVAGFIGSPRMNFIRGNLHQIEPGRATIAVGEDHKLVVDADATGARAGDPVTFGIRPEHVKLTAAGENTVAGSVAAAEHLGDQSLLHVDWHDGAEPLVVRVTGESLPCRGEHLQLSMPRRACHLFDNRGAALRRTVEKKLERVDSWHSG